MREHQANRRRVNRRHAHLPNAGGRVTGLLEVVLELFARPRKAYPHLPKKHTELGANTKAHEPAHPAQAAAGQGRVTSSAAVETEKLE
jgi:hypothetical protein